MPSLHIPCRQHGDKGGSGPSIYPIVCYSPPRPGALRSAPITPAPQIRGYRNHYLAQPGPNPARQVRATGSGDLGVQPQCYLINSACRSNCCARSTQKVTVRQPRSSGKPFHKSLQDATYWPLPRPAPARRRASPCRYCNDCSIRRPTGAACGHLF